MLVPLDGSDLAETVLGYAKELAVSMDLDVTVLHVYNARYGEHAPMHRAYIERGAAIVRRQMEAFQRNTVSNTVVATAQVEAVLVTGHPAEEILRFADEHGMDLILMATHGRSGIRRWAMGSVASKILSASKIPVWLVPAASAMENARPPLSTWTLVVPLDGSQLAEAVIPHIEALARQWGSEIVDIVLIRVCEPAFVTADYPEANMPLSWGEHIENMESRLKLTSEQYLERIEERLISAGLNARSDVLMGNTAEMILDRAHIYPFCTIAMSSHGHSGLRRWAYGSVADRIVHGAQRPVFLVRST
jgi:nucleotide-binding universal stress UspA family protein